MNSLKPVRIALLLLVSLAAGGTSACGCKLVVCASGLRVLLERPPSLPYRVEAFSSASDTRVVSVCDSVAFNCSAEVTFADFLPSHVFVEVIAGTDTLRREFSNIKYQTVSPGCTECRAGTVTVR